MTTWILILTIWGAGYINSPMAIMAISGFQTEAACMLAANSWLKQHSHNKTAICAATK